MAGQHFVKSGHPDDLPRFIAEAAGLAAIRDTGTVRVPEVIACELVDAQARITLEWLDLKPLDRSSAILLGQQLAALHRCGHDHHGWTEGNFIGGSPQPNDWHAQWPRFFADCRLKPQLEQAKQNGLPRSLVDQGHDLLERLPAFFVNHQPRPSLLHGDLWGGNVGMLADGTPVIFDPAVYYGDREADLAMSELFGGFPDAFYASYRSTWPLEPGYESRRTLYNLYHVLNHFNLFGTAYLGQVQRMTTRLLADLRG